MQGHYRYILPVVDAHIAGVDLDVVVGGDGDDLHLLVARRGEVLVLDPQPLHPRAVQLPGYEVLLNTAAQLKYSPPQETHDPCLLPRARRSVHQQVREVSTLYQQVQMLGLAEYEF